MKHQTSAAGANTFWDLSLKYIPKIIQQRTKKVPKFIRQKRKITENHCPEVNLEYCYKNKLTGEIIFHRGTTAPVKRFRNTQKFEKLYEMAFVKVIILIAFL